MFVESLVIPAVLAPTLVIAIAATKGTLTLILRLMSHGTHVE